MAVEPNPCCDRMRVCRSEKLKIIISMTCIERKHVVSVRLVENKITKGCDAVRVTMYMCVHNSRSISFNGHNNRLMTVLLLFAYIYIFCAPYAVPLWENFWFFFLFFLFRLMCFSSLVAAVRYGIVSMCCFVCCCFVYSFFFAFYFFFCIVLVAESVHYALLQFIICRIVFLTD